MVGGEAVVVMIVDYLMCSNLLIIGVGVSRGTSNSPEIVFFVGNSTAHMRDLQGHG